jgi:uncharacterized protein (DUF58 family)
MLYPDFKELLSYESAAKGIGFNLKKKHSADISGNFLSHFKGQGMEVDEVRPYVYGDDVRDIDWRVSARTQKTHVKVYREERKRSVLIAVDNNDYMNFGTRGTFKNVQAAKVAAILGFAANKNQDKVGLYIFGNQKNRFQYLKPVNSKKALFTGLKTLCNESQEKFDNYSVEGAIFNLKRIGANPNILFIISDFRWVTEQFEENLFLLGKKAEVVLINIIDDNDRMVPEVGQLMLEYDNKRFSLNTTNRKGVERYKKTFAEKQRIFNKMARRLKARVININTKDDVLREISLGLK